MIIQPGVIQPGARNNNFLQAAISFITKSDYTKAFVYVNGIRSPQDLAAVVRIVVSI